MRYPLLAFLFVFVIPPFAAHALLTGRAVVVVAASPAPDTARLHHWTLPAATPANGG